MGKNKEFICDFCKKPITTKEVIEVEYVEADPTKFFQVSEDEKTRKYFHLATDRKSLGYNNGGCYSLWRKKTNDKFIPHGVRPVKKSDLENL